MFNLRARALSAVLMATFAAAIAVDLPFAHAQSAAHDTIVDPSIRPGDDFYGYANGPWLAATPRPEGVARLDTTSMLRTENARRVRTLIEDAAAPARGLRSPIAQRVGDYYSSWLDSGAIETRGMAPLSNDLAAIAAIADRTALAAYLGRTVRLDDGTNQLTESLWGVWIHQNFHDPDHYAAHLVQGGLLLDADDYLDPAAEHAARRATYRAHIANVLRAAFPEFVGNRTAPTP